MCGLLLFSLAVSGTAALRTRDRFASGGWFTDHVSHYSTALLFAYEGFAIYARPTRQLCAHAGAATGHGPSSRLAQRPEDVCARPEHAGKRPLIINWQDHVRAYPPGLYLYSAPEALLYAQTDVPFRHINQFSILKFLVAGHLLLLVLWRMLRQSAATPEWLLWLALPPIALAVVGWSLAGFYDPLAVLVLALGMHAASRERHARALFWYGAAVFLHFRALWFAPLGVLSLVALARQLPRSRLARGEGALLACGLLMAAVAGAAFLIALPGLDDFPVTNPVRLRPGQPLTPTAWSFLLVLACAAASLLKAREGWVLAVLLWQSVMLVTTPQTQFWHALFLIPLLLLPRFSRAPERVAAAVYTVFILDAVVVFQAWPMGGELLARLAQQLG